MIGLIGGMSWESTQTYYRAINEAVRTRLGGLHSAKIVLYSVNFHDIERLQQAGNWREAGRLLAKAASAVERAGADFIVLCTNTMHRVAEDIERAVQIPLLHIADATAQEIKRAGVTKVGLLGTRFTMEHDFYRGRITHCHGLDVVIPDAGDREIIHRVIYEELCLGVTLEGSRREYLRIIRKMADDGARGVILGCTEISLLVSPQDTPVPLFDTTAIHAHQAVNWALADGDLGG